MFALRINHAIYTANGNAWLMYRPLVHMPLVNLGFANLDRLC
jgi:hypothetical protein